MFGWIVGGLALLLFAAVVARTRVYARLLSPEHFLAIASRLPALKSAALSRVITDERDAIHSGEDPRVLRTDRGLAVVYTINREETRFIHHCSVSLPGQHVAQGSLQNLLAFVVLGLGLSLEGARFGRGATNVHHMHLSLSADEHAALAAQSPPEVSAASTKTLRVAALRARSRMRYATEQDSHGPD